MRKGAHEGDDQVEPDLEAEDLEESSFALSRPIKVGEETIDRLEFRDPHAGQLRSMDSHRGEAAKMLALIARMTGIPVKAIDRLHPLDLQKAQVIVERFFGVSASGGGAED